MVAKAQVYMCQYCNSLYLEEKDAIACEEVHAIDEHLNICDVREWDIDQYGDKRYPKKILLSDNRMSGSCAEYHLIRVSSVEDFYENPPWNELGEWGTKQQNKNIGDIGEEV